ncbi:MAG: hypothetical protein QM762_06620 [Chryseolinea sp.]
MLTRAIEALDRINRILSDENINTLTRHPQPTSRRSPAELRERNAMIADAQKAIQNARRGAHQIRQPADRQSGKNLVDTDGRSAP